MSKFIRINDKYAGLNYVNIESIVCIGQAVNLTGVLIYLSGRDKDDRPIILETNAKLEDIVKEIDALTKSR